MFYQIKRAFVFCLVLVGSDTAICLFCKKKEINTMIYVIVSHYVCYDGSHVLETSDTTCELDDRLA